MEEASLEEFHGVDALPFPQPGTQVDIFPGVRGVHTLPPSIPVGTWSTQLLMDPAGIAPHSNALFALGQDDAAWWVERHWTGGFTGGAADGRLCAAEL